MIRVYSPGPVGNGAALDNGGLTTEKTWVAPAGAGVSAVLLAFGLGRLGSMGGVIGGVAASEGGGVHAGSLDGCDTSLLGGIGSQVCSGGLAGNEAAG
jgi:hypothetical protein